MIQLTRLRTLDLSAPTKAGRPLHLSAASGLLWINSLLYVVADDELHLGVFDTGDNAPGHLIRLLDGGLPDSKADRKKHKPDFEALVRLPPHGDHAHGAILALGSGSKENRRSGALIPLDAQGIIGGPCQAVDLSSFLAPLDDIFSALNIEGAVVSDDELLLFQRGNGRDSDNAIIRYPLSSLLGLLRRTRNERITPSRIDTIDLGNIDGVPLGFTDAAALPGGVILFTSVAEDTADTYNDGPCVGAAIGIIDGNKNLRFLHRLEEPHKIEGVAACVDGNTANLLLVTDGDDSTHNCSRVVFRNHDTAVIPWQDRLRHAVHI